MNGSVLFELRTAYINIPPKTEFDTYDQVLLRAGNLSFYPCDTGFGENVGQYTFPLMTLFRTGEGVRINAHTNTSSFSTIGYYGNVHDCLQPPFSLGHVYYPYTNHPGSFQGGTLNLWTVSSTIAGVAREVLSGEGHYPPDHPRAYDPTFSLADHYELGSCRFNHPVLPDIDGACSGQYITLPFIIQPGWRYEIRARIKITLGRFDCIRIGNPIGEWFDVWHDIYSKIDSTVSSQIWHHLNIPFCATGTMLGCNRLWLGDKNVLSAADYEITWVEVKQFPPTDTSAVGSTCYVSQEMVAADTIQFGGLRLDPSQIVPDSTSGNVGDIRIIRDTGLGECRLYTKILPTVWKNVLLSL
jgi:hypothetical protein